MNLIPRKRIFIIFLWQKLHIKRTILTLERLGANSHVSLSIQVVYSSCIATIQWGLYSACLGLRGTWDGVATEERYFWDDLLIFHECSNGMIRRCITDEEVELVLTHCHSLPCGGHAASWKTVAKVLECGFYLPTLHKDAREFVKAGYKCQKIGNISQWNRCLATLSLK